MPVIAGATKDEISLWLALHRYFVKSRHPFTKLLPAKYSLKDPELYDFWVRTRSQAWKFKGVDSVLSALHTARATEICMHMGYDWDHQKPSLFIDFPTFFGAAHGTDIAFVTGNFTYGPISSYIYPESSERDQMQRTFMGAWALLLSLVTLIMDRSSTGNPTLPRNQYLYTLILMPISDKPLRNLASNLYLMR